MERQRETPPVPETAKPSVRHSCREPENVKDGFRKAKVAEGQANDSNQEVVVNISGEAAPTRGLSVGVVDDHLAKTHLWRLRLLFPESASAFPHLRSEWASAFPQLLWKWASPLVSE
jgi:hypothetical protein